MTKRLGKLELDVMKVIWASERTTVRQIWETLYPHKKLAYTTVATVVKKIEEKGFVTCDKQNRTYVYRPAVPKADVSQNLLRDLIDKFFEGSAANLVTALVHSKDIDQEDLQRIQRLMQEPSGEAGHA